MTPGTGDAIRFETDIRPLFRDQDVRAMRFAFDLGAYDDVSENAEGILERLRDGDMPCDGAWPAEQVERFARWVEAGKPR